MRHTSTVSADVMAEFARRTGLTGGGPSRRYLWTDAFAVCNFLDLFSRTGEGSWRELALLLVDQVHHTLGRHRPDDTRTGWISGLSEAEGERHPTAGGLRIGKGLPERPPGELLHEQLEWDRDGQYYHYLTKWMHALNRVARVLENPRYLRWAVELAVTAHARFTEPSGHGAGRMYWKMSIDLTRPLVRSMGQHDPLDGLVTCCELQSAAEAWDSDGALPRLDTEIGELAEMCRGIVLATDDPLGIGGLLFDACRTMQLSAQRKWRHEGLLERVLDSALEGLVIAEENIVRLPAGYRLPFREFGLSIGLHGVETMQGLVRAHPETISAAATNRLAQLSEYVYLREKIERFWLDAEHQEVATWRDHQEINMVMLATSLGSENFLTV